MKARIKFQKYGAMKFVGHLDVMRYFQKALRRAEFDNEYTKGYSPHQIMSFAAPLGVGLTSDGEYMDMELKSSDSPEIMIQRLNSVMTEGFHITGFKFLLEREEQKKTVTAMSLVSSADYLVSLKDGYTISDFISSQEEFKEAFLKFYSKEEIIIEKKTKNSEKEVNIKPMISQLAFDNMEYEGAAPGVADVYDNGIKIFLQLDTGSSINLKPELVIEALCQHLELPFNKFAWQVHRLEIYTRELESNQLLPLDCLER